MTARKPSAAETIDLSDMIDDVLRAIVELPRGVHPIFIFHYISEKINTIAGTFVN